MTIDHAPIVLVVEDDRLLRDMTLEMLREEGYSATGVGSAAEGMARLRASPRTALLITDINMPETNGLELARWVHDRYPEVKILIMSGREKIDCPILNRFAKYLQKPFSARAFLGIVEDLLDD